MAIAGLPFVMLLAFLFVVSARLPRHWSRPLRHSQLLGISIWPFFQYFANGAMRAAWSFGGLMIHVVVLIALMLYAILAFSHRWLFGVSAIQRGGIA